jgi:hypothetical protein
MHFTSRTDDVPSKGLDEKETSLLHTKHNTTLSISKWSGVVFEQYNSPSSLLLP